MTHQFLNVLSEETINYILSREEVVTAKALIKAKPDRNASESFTVPLTPALRSELLTNMGLELSNVTTIPMRWIKGDTPAHNDNGIHRFTHTHLVYLNNSNGSLVVDGVTYPISRGVGYRFSEGLSHETVGTTEDAEPRLLLGPMSEAGFAVGGSPTLLSYPGGTTLYLRQTAIGQAVSFSTDQISWSGVISWPCPIENNNTALGLLNVEFVSHITIDTTVGGVNGYFVCQSESIQFGSRILIPDGTRPIITIDGITDYPGLFQNGTSSSNGYNNIYIMNLEIRAAGGATLMIGGGWFGHVHFGKETTSSNTILLNCHSTGNISLAGGGIIGRYAGGVKCVSCSSSGAIGEYGGGISGADSLSSGVLNFESCWSSGTIGAYGGGITGQSTKAATITNCYSTGSMNGNAGGISGRYSGSASGHTISNCYSRGAIGDWGGGIIGSECGQVTITNCYSVGAIPNDGGGILGNLQGNTTNKTVSNCYVTGTTTHPQFGYIIPGYNNLTGSIVVVSGTVHLTNNGATTGWLNATANTTLTGVPASASAPIGVNWVYTGTNTAYELYAMGFTPYTRTVVSGSPPAMVLGFNSSVVAGKSTAPALISGRSYSILRVTGGIGSYEDFSINGTTGSIQTTRSTVPGVYTLTIRNNGSYHYTTYTLTITPYTPPSMFGMFTNNAQVYYKSHSLASGGIGGVRNHRRKARKT